MATRGRPKGPEKAKFHVSLFKEQKKQLEFLSAKLTGQPTVTGLIREAVSRYLDETMRDEALAQEYEKHCEPLRMVP